MKRERDREIEKVGQYRLEKRQCYGLIKAMKGMHKKSTDKVNKNR